VSHVEQELLNLPEHLTLQGKFLSIKGVKIKQYVLVLKSSLSVVHIWGKIVLTIIFCFKVEYCFPVMSYNTLHYVHNWQTTFQYKNILLDLYSHLSCRGSCLVMLFAFFYVNRDCSWFLDYMILSKVVISVNISIIINRQKLSL
jgi:hypothetical protein